MGIRKPKKSVVIILALLLLLASIGFLGSKTYESKKLSAACKDVVKQVEGDNYTKIKHLSCTIKSKDIGNSDLTARQYGYDGSSGDAGGCIDPGMGGEDFDSYCTSGYGVILSDGRIIKSVGSGGVIAPKATDPCYDVDRDKIKPTVQDLYFYNQQLYGRNVYENVQIPLFEGICTLNGTSLYRGGLPPTADPKVTWETITNVVATYSGFTGDCINSGDKPYHFNGIRCALVFTAASEKTDYCHNNVEAIISPEIWYNEFDKPGEKARGVKQECTDIYVERKATLGKCADISDSTLRNTCQEKATHPAPGVTRVRGNL